MPGSSGIGAKQSKANKHKESNAEENWSFANLKPSQTLWGPHGYHRYPAKFIPQLVWRLIEDYSTAHSLVGDPFLGSVSIPHWFDSTGTGCARQADRTSFQSHTGSIQRGHSTQTESLRR